MQTVINNQGHPELRDRPIEHLTTEQAIIAKDLMYLARDAECITAPGEQTHADLLRGIAHKVEELADAHGFDFDWGLCEKKENWS